MNVDLLRTPVLSFDRIRGSRPPLAIFTPIINIELQYQSDHSAYSGKVLYNRDNLPYRRFVNPPRIFYSINEITPHIALETAGFGRIKTYPTANLLNNKYAEANYHQALHDDTSVLLDVFDKRAELNVIYNFDYAALEDDTVLIGDSKKVRTTFVKMDKHDPIYKRVRAYDSLGVIVLIVRQPKNGQPLVTYPGVLTATGILYRIDDEGDTATPYACMIL